MLHHGLNLCRNIPLITCLIVCNIPLSVTGPQASCKDIPKSAFMRKKKNLLQFSKTSEVEIVLVVCTWVRHLSLVFLRFMSKITNFFILPHRNYQTVCWENLDWNRARSDIFHFICSLNSSHCLEAVRQTSACHAPCQNTSRKH